MDRYTRRAVDLKQRGPARAERLRRKQPCGRGRARWHRGCLGGTRCRRTARQVDGWTAWKQAVRDAPQPTVLLLLAHTVHDERVDDFGLEIGAGSVELVFGEDCLPEEPAIVLLLGCETAMAGDVAYERFPSLFRVAGAPVVIATLTEVLGRHAAPIASRLVAEIFRQCSEDTRGIGDVLLASRRQLLAEGLLPVLALVAFGDADWLLAP